MSLAELIKEAANYDKYILIYFTALPVLSYFVSLLNPKDSHTDIADYTLSAILSAVILPAILSLVLNIYTLFWLKGNLMHVNMTIYFAPIFSSILTLFLTSRHTKIKTIPGFQRLSSLITILLILGFVAYFLSRAGIHIVFFGSVGGLLIFGIALVILFKIASNKLFK